MADVNTKIDEELAKAFGADAVEAVNARLDVQEKLSEAEVASIAAAPTQAISVADVASAVVADGETVVAAFDGRKFARRIVSVDEMVKAGKKWSSAKEQYVPAEGETIIDAPLMDGSNAYQEISIFYGSQRNL